MATEIEAAEAFAGRYDISDGRTPDGAAYGGTMRMDRRGRFLHAEATLDDGRVRHVLAMPFAGRLVMAFGPQDKVEIGAYELTDEGRTLRGLWVPPGATRDDDTGCGREISSAAEHATASTGVWTITDAVAIDGQPYHGTLTIRPVGAPMRSDTPVPIQLTWDLHDGQYESFGLSYPDALFTTFSFEPDKPYGLIVYAPTGDALRGVRRDSGADATGAETIRRVG